jgi:hypothetical protein
MRLGGVSDIPLIMELCKEYNSLDGIRETFRLDEKYLESILRNGLETDYYKVIIPESNDGFLLFMESNFPWNPEPYLSDIGFYIRERSRGRETEGMIEFYENYARARGIKHVILSMMSVVNHKQLERYYRMKGYKQNSIVLSKGV